MGERIATLKYLDPVGAVQEFPHRNFMHERTIRDGREVPELLPGPLLEQMDSFGFGLQPVPASTASLPELRDPDALKKEYTPRLLEWLQRATGAVHVRTVNAVLRRSLPGAATDEDRDAMSRNHFVPGKGEFTGAIDGVHSDYTDDSKLVQLARAVQVDQGLHGGRWIAVNCWRPISEGPVSCWPLAICDGRSVDARHLRARETPENNNWVLNAMPEGEHQVSYSSSPPGFRLLFLSAK